METTIMGFLGTTIRIHSFLPSYAKVSGVLAPGRLREKGSPCCEKIWQLSTCQKTGIVPPAPAVAKFAMPGWWIPDGWFQVFRRNHSRLQSTGYRFSHQPLLTLPAKLCCLGPIPRMERISHTARNNLMTDLQLFCSGLN